MAFGIVRSDVSFWIIIQRPIESKRMLPSGLSIPVSFSYTHIFVRVVSHTLLRLHPAFLCVPICVYNLYGVGGLGHCGRDRVQVYASAFIIIIVIYIIAREISNFIHAVAA